MQHNISINIPQSLSQHQKEPLIVHDVPELPWMKFGVDMNELRYQPYLS